MLTGKNECCFLAPQRYTHMFLGNLKFCFADTSVVHQSLCTRTTLFVINVFLILKFRRMEKNGKIVINVQKKFLKLDRAMERPLSVLFTVLT